MPRLLIASGIYPPEAGGPATYLAELLPALQARDWQIEVIAYGDTAPPDEETGWPVCRIPRRSLPLRLADYALAARPRLRRADLVYCHTLGLPLPDFRRPRVYKIVGDQAWERALRRGWIPPDEDIDTFQKRRYGVLAERQKALRSYETRRAARVIVPGEYLRRMVCAWGVAPARVTVIPNALLPVPPSPARDQAGARALLGLAEGPLLLTAARLTPWKGIDRLLQALVVAPQWRLVVAGDGPQRATLERQRDTLGLGERVVFTGQLPRTQLALYMQAADWFALLSGYEGLSHTLLESLRAGTPVIVSDKGGNPEVVRHGGNGLLVPWKDDAALAAVLRQALEPQLRARLARNTGQGMERFSHQRMVAATDAALRACLREFSSGPAISQR